MQPSDPAQTLVTQCSKRIRESIITGDFLPDEKLKVASLAKLLQTGPTPVREALSRLANTGLVVATDNKGFRVRGVSEAEARDLYFTFAQIEQIAFKRSIQNGTAAWEGEVLGALHRLSLVEKKRSVEFFPWLKENESFHTTLVSACGSPLLLKIRDEVYQLLCRYTYLSFQSNHSRLEQNFKDHEDIAKAAISRKEELACKLMDAHLSASVEGIVKRLKENAFI